MPDDDADVYRSEQEREGKPGVCLKVAAESHVRDDFREATGQGAKPVNGREGGNPQHESNRTTRHEQSCSCRP